MKRVLCAQWWGWGVVVTLLVVTSCRARPNPDSDSESWRPISGHRVNRYRTDPLLGPGLGSSHTTLPRRLQDRLPSPGDCLDQPSNHTKRDRLAKVLCLSSKRFESGNETIAALKNGTETKREKSGTHHKELNNSSQVLVNDGLPGPKNDLPFGHRAPLGAAQKRNFNGSNPDGIVRGDPIFESGASGQRRRRGARDGRRRAKLKTTVVKVEEPLEDESVEWLPVSLAPSKTEAEAESSDTETNLMTADLVQGFVSNTLPDLKQSQQGTGTLVQIMSPFMSKLPSDSKWESASLEGIVISHTPKPHHQKPTMWHKRPSVILVQDTPEEFLPKPPNHHIHEVPKPEPHFPSSSPQPFPRPTYHYPRPSPEPPPKPIYHYPSAEPSPEPEYQYISSTSKPSSHPVHHYPVSEPHFPYTSVIIHTSTSIHPEPQPEPSPGPSWSAPLADYPEPDVEEEDPYPGPELIVGSDDSVSEPPLQAPTTADRPSRPTPPPIYIVATPISPASAPGSPLNPVTISSGRPPPSIVILSSPEDVPAASPPLADPVAPVAAAGAAGGGGGGGGLIPIVPIIPPIAPIVPVPVVPGLLGGSGGFGGGSGLAGSGNSNCPSIQVFNVQSISNSLENKDCVINLNSPVHNSIGDEQIEAPSDDILYDDIPDSSTVATTTKKPPSGSMSILEFLQDFLSSMTFFNPITMSFWSFLFAPVSILLASGLGVAALVLPWVFPSYWFGRSSYLTNRRISTGNSPYKFRESTLRFERSVKSGMHLNDFLDNIGLL